MRLLFYGRLTDLVGREPVEVAVPATVSTVVQLRAWLASTDPRLGSALSSSRVRAVVDGELVGNGHSILAATEVGFLPPVSGG